MTKSARIAYFRALLAKARHMVGANQDSIHPTSGSRIRYGQPVPTMKWEKTINMCERELRHLERN